jgi:hypothetical protein
LAQIADLDVKSLDFSGDDVDVAATLILSAAFDIHSEDAVAPATQIPE